MPLRDRLQDKAAKTKCRLLIHQLQEIAKDCDHSMLGLRLPCNPTVLLSLCCMPLTGRLQDKAARKKPRMHTELLVFDTSLAGYCTREWQQHAQLVSPCTAYESQLVLGCCAVIAAANTWASQWEVT
jgi:hypothetical protein